MKVRSLAVVVWVALAAAGCGKPGAPAAGAPKPVLTVSVATPAAQEVAARVPAYGGVFAWQEASLGTEVGGLRITELLAEVGDPVKKGQVLARLNADLVRADVAAQAASLADVEALLSQAKATADRARQLGPGGAMSQQDYTAALAAEKSAQAKHKLVTAQLAAQTLKLKYTTLVAPDDGVISGRTGNLGQVVPVGTELFRLIRQNKLEWRGEVSGEQLLVLKPGARAELKLPGGDLITGTVRKVAPAVDASTRTGLVYVDLPEGVAAKPGMYLHGAFLKEKERALTVPSSAIVRKDGKAYVLVVGAGSKVEQKEVQLGGRAGDAIAAQGIQPTDHVVLSGGSFLAEGDLVAVEGSAK